MSKLIIPLRFKIITAFTLIYLVWGSTYIAIRLAIDSIPPFLMAGFRSTVSGMILYFLLNLKDPVKPRIPEIKKSIFAGLLMIVGGNGMLVWSEQYVPTGLAALLLAMIPVWLVLLDSIFVTKKQPNLPTITGILFGIGGVVMLSRVDDNVLLTNPQGLSIYFYAFMLTLGAISWASGSLFSRTIKSSASIFYLISYQMLAGGVFLLLLGLFLGEMKQLVLEKITLNSSLALIYLIFFGSLITYSAYNWLLRKSTPAKVGTYAFFNPLVAVSLGWLFLNEQVTLRIIVGAIGILSAVLLVNQSRFFRRRKNIPRISRSFIDPKEGNSR
jgi:drug/metabolite transporter (DMT)-like permease